VSLFPAVPRLVVALTALAGLLAAALAPASADARRLGSRTLEQGDRGADVKALQRLLGRAGFRTAADGVFGSGTRRLVELSEREFGLRADGRATPVEIRRLRAAVSASRGTGGYAVSARRPVTVAAEDESRAGAGEAEAAERPAATTAPATTSGAKAVLTEDGLAVAPAEAPEAVKRVIAAANEIAKTPYRYGGGHGSWKDSGYDCSGSVSYALHGGDLLDSPMPSGSFTSWGDAGAGRWITIYANGGHMYMTVAGLRFDTSGRARSGSRWQRDMRPDSGYTVRHPAGL
jgi:peptidoglycan hydrolase-like protein with peptidoglycan-binding domain